jgi:hypothetical protein
LGDLDEYKRIILKWITEVGMDLIHPTNDLVRWPVVLPSASRERSLDGADLGQGVFKGTVLGKHQRLRIDCHCHR